MPEYEKLSPLEIEALRLKAARGELTLEECKRFIESTRAAFLSKPTEKTSKPRSAKPPTQDSVDFF